MTIKELLQLTIEQNASDLHLISGIAPTVRVDGNLLAVPSMGILTPDMVAAHLKEVLTNEQLERLTVNKEIDFSVSFSDKARFRVNAYTQRNGIAAAFRRIPLEVPSIESLNLPKLLHSFTTMRQGLVLVTGPTGHGKSSTLAAMLNDI